MGAIAYDPEFRLRLKSELVYRDAHQTSPSAARCSPGLSGPFYGLGTYLYHFLQETPVPRPGHVEAHSV